METRKLAWPDIATRQGMWLGTWDACCFITVSWVYYVLLHAYLRVPADFIAVVDVDTWYLLASTGNQSWPSYWKGAWTCSTTYLWLRTTWTNCSTQGGQPWMSEDKILSIISMDWLTWELPTLQMSVSSLWLKVESIHFRKKMKTFLKFFKIAWSWRQPLTNQ